MSEFRIIAAVFALLFSVCLGAEDPRPNILILFADDAGYADFGFQGGGIDGDFADLTPNLDALAEGGVRFTDGYVSAAVCTPSRAGLLTGRYQHRFGVETVYGPIKEAGLPASEITMADILGEAGYRTYALGKWHLGEQLPEHHPNQRGFDEFYGVLAGARTFFPYQGRNEAIQLQRNGTSLEEPDDQPYFTELLAEGMNAYLEKHFAEHSDQPFFSYLAFTAVHTPLEADPARLADPRIAEIVPEERKILAAMTIAMDDAVGSILTKLEELGEKENTIVVFLSDNGGPEDNENLRAPNWSDNGVLRGNKSQNFEGGIRVPFVIHWPTGIDPALQGQALPDVVTALDLLPTFVEAGAAKLPAERKIDGTSLLSRLRGESESLPERTLVWRQVQQKAVRKGDWKFYQANDRSEAELYHLATDPGETKNLAGAEPERLAALQSAYAEWEKEMIEPLWTARGMRVTSSEGGAETDTPGATRTASNLEAAFRRLDRNQDGKVTRQELPNAETFHRFDRNGDGVIEAAEVGIQPAPGVPESAPAEEAKVENRFSEITAFFDLEFKRDWIPGTRDAEGNWMGGTETNYLVSHQGKLYAAIGVWNADRDTPGFTGPAVLVKEEASGPWKVDFDAGRNSVRIATLASIEITTDAEGKTLESPVTLLAGGVSGAEHPGEVTVFTRNDETGDWEKSVVTEREGRRGGEIRHIFDHVDSVTGVHHVFATAVGGELYRAVYDLEAPGRLRWYPEPELSGRLARIMSFAAVGDELFLTVDITPDEPKNGGLFRRVDGPEPHWEWLGEWGGRTQHVGVAWIRGMVAIPDPERGGRELILASRETDGLIEVIDPSVSPPAREVEFHFKDHFAELLGAESGERVGSIIAYNEMTPAVHPDSGEQVHLLAGGAWVFPSGRRQAVKGEALILLRHADGSYATLTIPKLAGEETLRSVRTIVPSPFPKEAGRVWYLGGFDAAGGPHENTAWIYRGELPSQ